MTMRTTTGWLGMAGVAAAVLLVIVPAALGVVATGGDSIADIGGYRIHTFTNSAVTSSFAVTAGGSVDVLVVAGGGGGGGGTAAGGGAGGLIYSNGYVVSVSNYSVIVGPGGAGGIYLTSAQGKNGTNSVFGSLIAIGGGGGGGEPPVPGSAGGSGGGGGFGFQAGGAPTAGQGNAGGAGGSGSGNYPCGGGGGAGAVGGNGSGTTIAGNGGVGLAYSISGVTNYYAGGGGGATYSGGTLGTGGLGGGGNGGASNGVPNTGGGGGGQKNDLVAAAGAGGSGIVIVRYLSLAPSLSSVATDPTSSNPIPVTVTFSEAMSEFTNTDILTTNAAVQNFAMVSPSVYTFDLMASNVGIVSAWVPPGVCTNGAGLSNVISDLFVRDYQLVFTRKWTAAAGVWENPANWAGGNVPVAGENAMITNVGAIVYVTNAVAGLSTLTLSRSLVFSNWTTCLSATNIIVQNGGTMTCAGPFTNAPPTFTNAAALSNRVWLACDTLTVGAGGSINVSAKGYAGAFNAAGWGPGKGWQYAGAGHGGRGGYYGGNPGGVQHDAPEAPEYPGSGGGGWVSTTGGHGGGAVRIQATNWVEINGTIVADGQNGVGSATGAGSGGAVYISTRVLRGTGGQITAKGGTAVNTGGAGGGGCIAVVYDPSAQSTSPVPEVLFLASFGENQGGGSGDHGKVGTLYFPDNALLRSPFWHSGRWMVPGFSAWSVDSLTVISNGCLVFPSSGFSLTVTNDLALRGTSYVRNRLELTNATVTCGGNMLVTNGLFSLNGSSTSMPTLNCGGDLLLTNGARVYVYAGVTNDNTPDYGAWIGVTGTVMVTANAWLYPISHPTNGGSAYFRVGSAQIGSGGGIDASARGFVGRVNLAGYGPGAAALYAGGGYGGDGGKYSGNSGGYSYGSANMPVDAGSSGGGWSSSYGGAGGGLVRIVARGTVTVEGAVTATGEDTTVNATGAGAGGGIFIIAREFAGSSGSVNARGGSCSSTGGGGGGGRIALWRAYDTFAGSLNFTNGTHVGGGGSNGYPGTLFLGWAPVLKVGTNVPTARIMKGSSVTNASFSVWNVNAGRLGYTISDDATWLSVAPAMGISEGAANPIACAYNAAGLAAGSYTGIVTVTGVAAFLRMESFDNPQFVRLILEVMELKKSLGGLTNVVMQGCIAGSQSFQVWNAGPGSFNYTVTSNVAWMSASPGSGTLGAFGTNTIAVNYNTMNLAPGIYSGRVTVASAEGGGATQTVDVVMKVAGLSVSSTALSQTIDKGSPASAQSFSVWNPGGGVVSYTVSDDMAWVSESPASGTLVQPPAGGAASIAVSYADLSGYGVGTYAGTITLVGSDGGFGASPSAVTQAVAVTVSVVVPAAPVVSASDGGYLDKVRVTWPAVNRATQYEVWKASAEAWSGASLLASTNGTLLDDTNCVPGVRYYYWARGVNGNGLEGELSAADGGHRGLTAPAGVQASDGYYTSRVDVTWGSVEGASGYEVWRSPFNSASVASRIITVSGTNSSDMATEPYVTYYYWVKAITGVATSAFGVADSGYRAALGRPREVTATDGVFYDRVRVTWPAVEGATAYQVWRGSGFNTNTAVKLSDVNALGYD
ncbi:MAG: hypothetical protein HY343_04150, partial [Lentisphaerae bacterium]|nr:hypothetical protein [Lentisphaerota bacterium]